MHVPYIAHCPWSGIYYVAFNSFHHNEGRMEYIVSLSDLEYDTQYAVWIGGVLSGPLYGRCVTDLSALSRFAVTSLSLVSDFQETSNLS